MGKNGIRQLKEYVNQFNNFLIVGHIDPDGDCISSVLSMTFGLRRLGKTVIAAIDSPCPTIFESYPPVSQISFLLDVEEHQFDGIIIVDSSSSDRMGKYETFLGRKPTFVIDHHITNNQWADHNWVDPSASSAAEMIYQFLSELDIEFEPVLATINLLGIQTDTGFFKYTNTGYEVMERAAKLIKNGAKASFNASMITENNRVEEFHLLADMAKNIRLKNEGKLIYSHITKEMIERNNCSYEDSTGLIGQLRSIKGVETAILFTEMEPEEIKVSFRSKKWFDVAKIALEYSGGGHQRASGCTIYKNMEQAVNEVINKTSIEMKKAL